jgi:hypothetical protein
MWMDKWMHGCMDGHRDRLKIGEQVESWVTSGRWGDWQGSYSMRVSCAKGTRYCSVGAA